MLTIHQLKVFLTVADTGSVRLAAERLVVTQPAVSASLAALEREVGATLFGRAGRGIELTTAGRTMARYAQLIVGLVDEAVAAVAGENEQGGGTIRVAAVTAAADLVVAPALARIRERQPNVGIAIEIGNRDRIWQLLTDRTVDVAVGSRPPVNGDLTSVASRPNEMILVAKPGSVWKQRIGEATWLLREPGSGTRGATEEVIANLGITPPTLTVGSNAAIQTAAESGLGVALLPRDAVADAVRQRRLGVIHVASTPLQRPWHVVVRAGETLPTPARAFIDSLVDEAGFTRGR